MGDDEADFFSTRHWHSTKVDVVLFSSDGPYLYSCKQTLPGWSLSSWSQNLFDLFKWFADLMSCFLCCHVPDSDKLFVDSGGMGSVVCVWQLDSEGKRNFYRVLDLCSVKTNLLSRDIWELYYSTGWKCLQWNSSSLFLESRFVSILHNLILWCFSVFVHFIYWIQNRTPFTLGYYLFFFFFLVGVFISVRLSFHGPIPLMAY